MKSFPRESKIVFLINGNTKGIRLLRYVYHGSALMSFRQLQQKHNIASEHFYIYLQVCHFILSKVNILPTNTPLSREIESFLLNQKDTRRFLSRSYSLFYSTDPTDISKIIQKWEKDLNMQYIENDTKHIYLYRMRETQYRMLHRSHITLSILNKMDKKNISSLY